MHARLPHGYRASPEPGLLQVAAGSDGRGDAVLVGLLPSVLKLLHATQRASSKVRKMASTSAVDRWGLAGAGHAGDVGGP